MSSSPGSRSSQTAIFALAVGAALIGVILILLYYGVNVLQAGQEVLTGLYPPIAVTTQGAEIRNLYTVIFLIAVAIFLVVEGLIIWTVIRYRRKPGDDTLPPQTHGNNIAEFVWTIVPTIIVVFMFFVSWQTLNQVDTATAGAQTKIRAIAGQFQWQFDYLAPDGTTVLYTEYIPLAKDGGGMTVPAGRTVLLSLVSNDVIHAFYVPQFLFKRDVVPGRTNQFDFMVNASDAGQTFRGQCAELCGVGHSNMLFDVHALAATEFDTWLAEKVKSNPPPAPSGAAPSGAAPSGAAPSGGPVPSGATPSGAAPSGAASSGGPEGATVKISAKGIQYEQASINAAAGQPFKIEFANQDAGTPHNVSIHQGPASGTEVFKGEIFPGVATKTYDVPALTAGSYTFACTVHPSMTGTLTVQ